MKFIKIFIISCILFFSITLVESQDYYPWEAVNRELFTLDCEKTNCVLIDFKIITESGEEEYIVGDDYHYTFKIKNMGEKSINSDYKIEIISLELNSVISEETIKVELSKGETKEYPETSGKSHRSYSFLKEGSYRIRIKPEEYTYFIYSPIPISGQCKDTHGEFGYSYDVVSRWEKKWIDESQKLQEMVFNSVNSTNAITERIFDLNQEMVNSSKNMEDLTKEIRTLTYVNVGVGVVILFCTIVNVIISVSLLACTVVMIIYQRNKRA